jgi:putative intracellular protease/amidase
MHLLASPVSSARLLVILLLPLLVAAAAAPAPAPLALAGLDPVLLVAGEEAQGDDSIDLVHGPFRYVFTSVAHRARFQAAPDRYRIQGNATCTVFPGVGANPGEFMVHAGRIYAFSSGEARLRFADDPARFLDDQGQPRGFRDARQVAILIYEGVEVMDVAVPGVVFQVAGRDGSFKAFTVAASTAPVLSQGYLRMVPEHTFASSPKPDVLIIPGGAIDDVVQDTAVMDWVRRAAADADVVLSLSTGAFIMASAGLLDGLQATTHPGAVDLLRSFAQRTMVVPGEPYLDTGKVITSPGGAAGLDASLHVLERLAGSWPTQLVARYLSHPWQPAPPAAP